MKKILSFVIVLLAVCWPAQLKLAFGLWPETTFQMVLDDDDQSPLEYRTVYVYRGDYKFKADTSFDVYPYGREAFKRHWLMQTVKADGRGKFALNMDALDAKNICFKVGQSYRLICIEKSSDLKHTPSNEHLRVIRFDRETGQVVANSIYDLKRGVVNTVLVDGVSKEKPFKKVELVVQKEE